MTNRDKDDIVFFVLLMVVLLIVVALVAWVFFISHIGFIGTGL